MSIVGPGWEKTMIVDRRLRLESCTSYNTELSYWIKAYDEGIGNYEL